MSTPNVTPFVDPRVRISVTQFQRQMRFLAETRRVMGIGDLVRCQREGAIPRSSVVVTFDDGYLDTLTTAAPILARYGLPAVVYLPTDYVTLREPPWVDRLYAAFRHRTRERLQVDGHRFALHAPEQEQRARALLEPRLMVLGVEARSLLLEDIEAQLKPRVRAPQVTMGWDDVRALQRRYPQFELGIHTAEHIDLTSVSLSTARADLLRSQKAAVSELGRELRHFSFPYSRDNTATRALVGELGFESAVGSGASYLIDARSDLMHLSRIDPLENPALFRFWTSGAYPDLPRSLWNSPLTQLLGRTRIEKPRVHTRDDVVELGM